MSTENTPADETASPDKSSEPAAAETKAPQVSTDENGNTVRGTSDSDGRTDEHRADESGSAADDDGLVDVDEVLTGESSDDGPPEMPA